MKFNTELTEKLEEIVNGYYSTLANSNLLHEREFIEKTVDYFQNVPKTSNVKIRAGILHQKPYVIYFIQGSLKPWKRELCDLLYLFRYWKNGILDTQNAMLVQAKLNRGSPSYEIEIGQFYLLHQWPEFTICGQVAQNHFNIYPTSDSFSTYCFFNRTSNPIFNSAGCISIRSGRKYITNFHYRPYIGQYKYGLKYLDKFILGKNGEKIDKNREIKSLIIELLKIVRLSHDPPDEYEFEKLEDPEETGGFGVVEFNIDQEGFEKSRDWEKYVTESEKSSN